MVGYFLFTIILGKKLRLKSHSIMFTINVYSNLIEYLGPDMWCRIHALHGFGFGCDL